MEDADSMLFKMSTSQPVVAKNGNKTGYKLI
jgi:hypothetical protein